jgi:hypothetical protein
MKRTLQILGGILLAFVLVVAGGGGYFFVYLGPRLDASSKAYVDQALPAVVNDWSREALWTRAAPEFKNAVSAEQLDGLFEKFSQALGKLQSYDGSSGEANMSLLLNEGKITTARYKSQMRFEKGPAEVSVGLIEHDGQWQILSVTFNSPLLLK